MTNPASLYPSLTQSCTCQHPHFAHLLSESSPNQHPSLHSGGLRRTHTLLIEGSRNCLQALHKMAGLPLKSRDSLLLTVHSSSFESSLLTPSSSVLLEKLSSSANPEILHSLWRPNGHYRVHRSQVLFPMPSQVDPVHSLPTYYLKYTLILSATGLPSGLLSLGFPTEVLFVSVFFH